MFYAKFKARKYVLSPTQKKSSKQILVMHTATESSGVRATPENLKTILFIVCIKKQ